MSSLMQCQNVQYFIWKQQHRTIYFFNDDLNLVYLSLKKGKKYLFLLFTKILIKKPSITFFVPQRKKKLQYTRVFKSLEMFLIENFYSARKHLTRLIKWQKFVHFQNKKIIYFKLKLFF